MPGHNVENITLAVAQDMDRYFLKLLTVQKLFQLWRLHSVFFILCLHHGANFWLLRHKMLHTVVFMGG